MSTGDAASFLYRGECFLFARASAGSAVRGECCLSARVTTLVEGVLKQPTGRRHLVYCGRVSMLTMSEAANANSFFDKASFLSSVQNSY